MISRLIKMLISFLTGIKNVFLIEKHVLNMGSQMKPTLWEEHKLLSAGQPVPLFVYTSKRIIT